MTVTAFTSLTIFFTALAATAPTSMRSETDEIRVMSFNIRYGSADDGEDRWQNRRAMLLRTIDSYAPDLLGTQEVLAFQADELRDHLKGYGFVGVGRDDGKRKGEFAAMFYRADRFELLASGHFWLSEHPDQPGSVSWDSSMTRMASWVKLKDKRSPRSQPLVWINTHWDHRGQTARLESAKLIRSQLTRLTDNGALQAIITGDFNAHEDSEACRTLFGARGALPILLDSYRQAHPTRGDDEASFHAFKGTTAGSRIDFILHTAGFHTISASIDHTSEGGRFPSDHFPVTASLGGAE